MSAMDAGRPAQEILKRAAEACRVVRSYRVVETDVQEHFTGRTEEVEERIQVGDDSYSRRIGADGHSDPHEELTFRGETYWRESTGGWAKPIVVASRSLSAVTTWQGDDAETDDFQNRLDGGLFKVLNLDNVKRLPDEEIEGRMLMRFHEESEIQGPEIDPEEWHREFRSSFPRPEVAPPMPDEALRFLSPEQIKFIDDLWIGTDDLLLHRSESRAEFHNRGEVTARVHTTREYSQFNSAELPGPLPES
jgi:hypothetical protein